MKNFFKFFQIGFVIGGILMLVLFLYQEFSPQTIKAGSGANVSGWAWSENIGWISFNNTTGGGTTDYGVNIDTGTGDFSGYAWSENIGLISFNRADTGNPPGVPFNGGSGPVAQLNASTNKITGWGRALANGGGWDGWIKLAKDPSDAGSDYGVTRSGLDLIGYAWGGDVIGWISFDNITGGGTTVYGVTTSFSGAGKPSASISAPASRGDYCVIPPSYSFVWTYNGPGQETQFEFQIDNKVGLIDCTDSDPGTICEVDLIIPSSADPGGSNNQAAWVVESPVSGEPQIAYNDTYYWRVRVSNGSQPSDWSDWAYPPIPVSFKTDNHRYPNIDFNPSKSNPRTNENVIFTDNSTVYGAGTTKSSYSWTFPDGDPATASGACPGGICPQVTTKFITAGPKNITLEITDSDGYKCPGQKSLTVYASCPTP